MTSKKIILIIHGKSYRSFSAYKLYKQAAELGHIGAKEELAFAHLIGVHLPMNFQEAKKYFDEGVLTGSAKSHFVCLHRTSSLGSISESSS